MRHLDDTAARLSPGPKGASAREPEALDPELMALHAPPQAQRFTALTLMAAAVVAAMALVVGLRADIGYAFSRNQPVDLGNVRAVNPSGLVSNSYVRLAGTPTIGHAMGFTRGLGARYRVFPLAGQRTIYVQVRDSGGESFVRSEYTGRLMTFDDLGGRYAELGRAMQREAGLPVTSASFLLLADEPPSAYTWTFLVALVCVAFVLLDVYFIVRWFRPLKWAAVASEKAV